MQFYKTFDDLLKGNKGLFKLFSKTTNNRLLKAIWDARQPEIELLKEKITFFERKVEAQNIEIGERTRVQEVQAEEIRRLEAIINSLSIKKDSLHYQVSFMESEIDVRDQKIAALEGEINKLKSYSGVMEQTLKLKDAADVKTSSDRYGLEENLQIAHQTILELDRDLKQTKSELLLAQKELNERDDELKDSKAMTRQFKELNFKMSNELYKLNHEIERLNGFN